MRAGIGAHGYDGLQLRDNKRRNIVLRKFITLADCELEFFLFRIGMARRAQKIVQLRGRVGRVSTFGLVRTVHL